MEQSDLENYGEIFRGETARPLVVILVARPNIGFQGKRTPRAAPNPTAASQMPASRASGAGPGPSADKLGQLPEDMGSIAGLLVQVMRAQAESTLTMHQLFQTTLLENIRVTGVAVSATGAVKEAKLTESKIKILHACSGEDNESLFVLPKVYSKVDWDGHTRDNYSRVMRQLVVAVPGSAYKCNVHITPKLVATVKTLNVSANDDRTFDGCAKGITPFAVLWLSAEAVNSNLAEERYYQESTLKTTAGARKRESSSWFEPPTSLQGLVRVLTNYIRLVEVLFRNRCAHLLCVVQIRDGLDYQERLLENKVTPALMISVLWRVHQDAWQFFDRCEKWEEGKALPRLMLHTMVASLVDDVNIQMSLTCPVAEFLGPDTSTTAGTRVKRAEGTRGTPGQQPTWNPSIPSICLPCVNKMNRLYPTMSILSFCKKGKVKYPDVSNGEKGDCATFGLLGRCTEDCTFRHVVITVPDGRQHAVKKTLMQGLATLALKAPKAPPA
jgi:hypothetical protein